MKSGDIVWVWEPMGCYMRQSVVHAMPHRTPPVNGLRWTLTIDAPSPKEVPVMFVGHHPQQVADQLIRHNSYGWEMLQVIYAEVARCSRLLER